MFGSHFAREKKVKTSRLQRANAFRVHANPNTNEILGIVQFGLEKDKNFKVQEQRDFRRHVRNLGNLVLFFISSLDAMLPKFQRLLVELQCYIVEVSASSF